MFKCKTPIPLTYFLIIILSGIFVFCTDSAQASAKQKYLAADSCYKKLRNKSIKKQTAREWLRCISQYEIIYRLYPDDSWAPAGMYKASQLYINLSKLSGKKKYKIQAADLLSRLNNKYPGSAYAGRARSLLKSIKVDPGLYTKKIKHIQSKKQLTKNDVLIRKFIQNENNLENNSNK